MFKLLITASGLILGGYLLLLAFVYFTQSRMVYFPVSEIFATPASIGASYDDVWLTTEDNTRIHGWYVKAPGATKTLLFFHGNGGNISHRLSSIQIFLDLNMDVLIIDYRGYGQSEGTATEEGTYNDAIAAWDFLLDKGIEPGNIVIFGRSLGGAIAAWLAARTQPAGLILESAFTSIIDIAGYHYPLLPVRWLSRFHYDSLARANKITSPILVIHSPDDEVVPFHLGEKLYAGLPGEKAFVKIRGGHNDGFVLSGDLYTDTLAKFLDSLELQ